MDRLFFAAHPDADAATRIAALTQSLQRELGLKGRPLPPERSHLTLLFVGTYPVLPAGLAQRLAEVVDGLALPPFELRFDRIASFNRRRDKRPLVLLAAPDGPVATLHEALASRLRAAGLAFESHRPYAPHLTLMYDDRRVDARPVAPITWTVREFVLMHSLVGRSTHRPLGHWALQA